jgi:hypothetical protein
MKAEVVLDGFRVVRSNVILFRTVLNDANVGPRWWIHDWYVVGLGPKEHSLQGLKDWMAADGHYDMTILVQRAWDSHLWDYGLRQQFWVPVPSDNVWSNPIGKSRAVCVDATGRDWLEVGKEYKVEGASEDMVVVVVDGQDRECLADRFRIG